MKQLIYIITLLFQLIIKKDLRDIKRKSFHQKKETEPYKALSLMFFFFFLNTF
ncbi:hypothetical protein [Chlamydia felis Fe/C-56]|uniref:Uncharacterized protein n=1 Tax=Chlamydia felis (strain Fe/C-56) TaxID=264202 RepID=Q253W1_CHLFF|nr:hypothetical protein [Chlamydia felis Fe/C-56]